MEKEMLGYLRVIKMSVQNVMQFRGHYLINLFQTIGMIPLLLLWQIILKKGNIGSYDINSILTYTVMSSIMETLFSTSVGGDICGEIREGRLSGYLVEPVSHLGSHFCIFLGKSIGESLPKSGLQLLTVVIISRLLKFRLVMQASEAAFFLSLLVEGMLIAFLVNLVFGLIGFWITETSTFFMLLQAAMSMLTGSGIPLDILPWGMDKILLHTPFAFMAYYPIKAGIGQLASPWIIMGQGFLWIVVLVFLVKITWKRGLNKYSAPGG